jgi:phosphate transport system substrate-binding protein
MHTHTRWWLHALCLTALVATVPAHGAARDDSNVLHWAGCGITKKAFMTELAAAYQKRTGTRVALEGGGATRGIRDTAALVMDMGGSCRMSLPETDRAEMHVTLHPVAWDALALIAHPDNPVENLSADQIRAVYTGRIGNWRELGGPDAPIHLYVRTGRISGVGYAIRQYLFEDSQVEFVTDYVVPSSGPLEQAVERDPLAVGITGVSSARKRNVKLVSIDGKSPTYDNVRSGGYGLYRPLYLVTSPGPSPEVKAFVAFAMSEDGRQVLRNNGTVPYRDAPNLISRLLIYGFGVR